MSAHIVAVTKNEGNEGEGATYDLEASGAKLAVRFYRGDPTLNELAWRAEITFVSAETIIAGEGVNPRAAFLAAASRQEVIVRQGIPLPAIGWFDVERALEGKDAFRAMMPDYPRGRASG